MSDFEKEFEKLMKKHHPVSQTSRKAFDDTYKLIGMEQRKKEKKRKLILRWLTAACFFVAASAGLLLFTPMGQAVGDFLRFNHFHSETLRDEHFVTAQNSKERQSNTEISLKEVYMDQKEIGIHFSIDLPKDSKLIDKNIHEYGLNFALKNGDGSYLFDNRRDQTTSEKFSAIASSYTKDQYLNKADHTLEISYKLVYNEGQTLPKLENAKIEVTRISGMHDRPQKQGFSQVDITELNGKWNLPIDTSKIQEFPLLEFEVKDDRSLGIRKAMVYPTKFVLQFDDFEKFASQVKSSKGYLDAKLCTNLNGEVQRYDLKKIEGNDSAHQVKQWIFDYDGYDQSDTLTLQIGDTNIELSKINK